MEPNPWAVAGIAIVGAATFWLSYTSSRAAVSTTDFLVARRVVRVRRNAAALSGEYLSAASFLGVAGLVLADGADALWYSLGFTAGFLTVLMFVAAPLRRSGAYTLPDFAEARFSSRRLRGLCTALVLLICYLYLVPQLQGAGLVLAHVLPVPSWVGAVVVLVLVVINVLSGGMRSATLVQAVQYWVKLFAVAAPTFVLCLVFLVAQPSDVGPLGSAHAPVFAHDTTVQVRTPVRLSVRHPARVRAQGRLDGHPVHAAMTLKPGWHRVAEGATLRFSRGDPVPAVADSKQTNRDWIAPATGTEDTVDTYSLMIALFLGVIGLPHVLARFYTTPDGRAARRTVLRVLALLAVFYVFPVILGVLSRLYVPQLLVTGRSDAAILDLPTAVLPGVAGRILAGLFAAGAFAALLATSSGLLVSLSGVMSTSLLPGRVRDFRWAAVFGGLIPLAIAIVLRPEGVATSVGMAFALAASTFAPLMLFGIWWRGLSVAGAAAGMIVGAVLVLGSIALSVLSDYTGGWAPPLLGQPALYTVPVVFAVMVLVSRATRRQPAAELNSIFLRLHAPDPLGLVRDRDTERFGPPGTPRAAPGRRGRHRKRRGSPLWGLPRHGGQDARAVAPSRRAAKPGSGQ